MAIHDSALVDPAAEIGDDVTIGPFTIVHADVVLGSGSTIGSHCVVGEPSSESDRPLVIGEGAVVRSHSVLYRGSTFGPGLMTGHRVTMLPGVEAGAGLRIGTGSDLLGDSVFGDHVRLHSNVFVPKRCRLEDFVWLFPGVVMTDDPRPPSDVGPLGPHIEAFAAVAAASVVLPGVRIGRGAVVAAASTVTRDVGPGRLVKGSPAADVGPVGDVRLPDGRIAYPWTEHFHRGYPPEVIRSWTADDSTG